MKAFDDGLEQIFEKHFITKLIFKDSGPEIEVHGTSAVVAAIKRLIADGIGPNEVISTVTYQDGAGEFTEGINYERDRLRRKFGLEEKS